MTTTLNYELTELDIAVLDQLGIDYTDNGDTVTLDTDDYSRIGNIADYGIDGGFSGFIYYSETVKFAKNNFNLIKDSLTELYGSMGEDVIEGMKNWGCLRSHELTTWDIAEALYAEGEWETQVYNALAWYAAEETARRIADAEELETSGEVYENFPCWALPYAYYGEDESLTDEERDMIDSWLNGREIRELLGDNNRSFSWSPAFGKACDCCTVEVIEA